MTALHKVKRRTLLLPRTAATVVFALMVIPVAVLGAAPQTPNVGGKGALASPPVKSARLQRLQQVVDTKAWMKDPFRTIKADMTDVIQDLAVLQTKTPAEVTQPLVLSRLDALIKLLEKQCKSGGGGNPNSPLMKSILAKGPGGQGDLRSPGGSRRKWAELTPKERDRILQAQTQGFPAGYEEVLGEYFRRLATEESVRAVGPAVRTPQGAAETPRTK